MPRRQKGNMGGDGPLALDLEPVEGQPQSQTQSPDSPEPEENLQSEGLKQEAADEFERWTGEELYLARLWNKKAQEEADLNNTEPEIPELANEADIRDDVDGESDTGDRTRKYKSKRINDEAVEDDLVEWLRENPVLWDPTQRDFRLAKKKESLWIKKAKEFDRSGDFLKGWYKDLRDHFVKLRLRKDKMGDGAHRFTYRENWVLQRFDFLAHTVKHRGKNRFNVAAANEMASGDSVRARRIAAVDRLSINSVADDPMAGPSDPMAGPSGEGEAMTRKRKRTECPVPSLAEVTCQLFTTQMQVMQLHQQQLTDHRADRRASYLEYLKSVVHDISEEEWEDFHKLCVELEFKWRRNARGARQRRQQHLNLNHDP